MGYIDLNNAQLDQPSNQAGKFIDLNSVQLDPPPPSKMDYLTGRIADATGNLARGVYQAIAGIADTPEIAYNLTQQGLEKLTGTQPRTQFPYRLPLPVSGAVNAAMNAVKVPNDMPDVQRVGTGIGGGAVAGPAGIASGVAGAGGGIAAEHMGYGPVGQTVASLAAGGIPSVVKAIRSTRPTAQQLMAAQLRSRPDMGTVIGEAQNNLAQAGRAGIPLSVAEATEDPNLLRMQAVLNGEPVTQGAMAQFYRNRDALVPTRLQSVAQNVQLPEGMVAPQSSQEAANVLTQAAADKAREITTALSSEASPLYEEAFGKHLAPNNPILKDPIVQHYIGAARRDVSFAPQTNGMADNSVAVLDAAKRKMDQAINTSYDPAAPANTAAINTARANLLDSIDTQLNNNAGTNAYKQAREIYSGQPDQLAMRQRIGALADMDTTNPQTVANSLSRAGSDATQGVVNALGPKAPVAGQSIIYNALEGVKESPSNGIPGAYSVPNKIYNTPADIARMNALMGPQNAGAVQDVMDTVRRANMSNALRGGSKTADMLQAGENLKSSAPVGKWFKSAVSLSHGDYVNTVGNLISKIQSGKGYDPEVLTGLQKILTGPEGSQFLKTLKNNPNAFSAPSFRQRLLSELGSRRMKALAYTSALNAQRKE